MSVLNKSDDCDCGSAKDWRKQWCEECFSCLTKTERRLWTYHVTELARLAHEFHNKIQETRNQPA